MYTNKNTAMDISSGKNKNKNDGQDPTRVMSAILKNNIFVPVRSAGKTIKNNRKFK